MRANNVTAPTLNSHRGQRCVARNDVGEDGVRTLEMREQVLRAVMLDTNEQNALNQRRR